MISKYIEQFQMKLIKQAFGEFDKFLAHLSRRLTRRAYSMVV